MKHNLSPTKIVALLACYLGESPMNHPDGLYGGTHPKAGTPVWRGKRRAGGAAWRTVEELRNYGFITQRNPHDALADQQGNLLTLKGFEALEEKLDKLPTVEGYDGRTFTFQIDRCQFEADKAARAQLEAERAVKIEQRRIERRRQAEERAQRDRDKLVARFRQLFKDHELDADDWNDRQVLEFAEQAGDAVNC